MRKEQHMIEAYERLRLKLKEARTSAGMTQLEVARRLARPQSFVSKLETRERRVDFIEVQVLAWIYGKPISFFVDNGGFIGGMGELDRLRGVERASSGITTADIAALETTRGVPA